MRVEIRREGPRRCGHRKAGGLYLMADGAGAPCGKLPVPLGICPTCGGGIKFSRSWTWINGAALLDNKRCRYDQRGIRSVDAICASCLLCGLSDANLGEHEKVGLLWVGAEHYPTPKDFLDEADAHDISRRIKTVPRDFRLGDTWVWLAHIHCIPTEEDWQAGVFKVFRPRAIEYVVRGDESEDELERLVERGITPVEVVPLDEWDMREDEP